MGITTLLILIFIAVVSLGGAINETKNFKSERPLRGL